MLVLHLSFHALIDRSQMQSYRALRTTKFHCYNVRLTTASLTHAWSFEKMRNALLIMGYDMARETDAFSDCTSVAMRSFIYWS